MSPGRASLMAKRNGFTAVDLDGVFHSGLLQTNHRIVDDGAWIFASGIVGSEHDEIATAAGRLAHQRTLGAVAITAATEYGYHSGCSPATHDELSGQSREVTESIIGVSVVDHHGERLAAVDALESSGHMGQRRDAAGDGRRVATARRSRRPQPPGCCTR